LWDIHHVLLDRSDFLVQRLDLGCFVRPPNILVVQLLTRNSHEADLLGLVHRSQIGFITPGVGEPCRSQGHPDNHGADADRHH